MRSLWKRQMKLFSEFKFFLSLYLSLSSLLPHSAWPNYSNVHLCLMCLLFPWVFHPLLFWALLYFLCTHFIAYFPCSCLGFFPFFRTRLVVPCSIRLITRYWSVAWWTFQSHLFSLPWSFMLLLIRVCVFLHAALPQPKADAPATLWIVGLMGDAFVLQCLA